jgi:tetratricopeptide (TPR) repeat protein
MWLRSLGILATITATGCGRSGGADASATKSLVSGPGEVALSEAECRDYAEAVVKAVEAGYQVGLNALVDWDSVFRAATTGWNIPDNLHEEVIRGLREGVEGELGLTGRIITNSKQGGRFSFLGARRRHDRQVILFRMIRPVGQGGVAYFEFDPNRDNGGRIRAADVFVYATGEFLSESFRRGLLPWIADRSRTIGDKLIAGEQDYIRDYPRLRHANELLNQGKACEALATYKSLRPETCKQKQVLLARLVAAQACDDREYAAVVADIQKYYPDDPCVELASVDAFMLRGELPGAMKAIDRLDKSIGGDPYLDSMRAGIREAQGDLEGAQRYARRAIEREPSLLQGYLALLGCSLKLEKYDETVTHLKEIDQKFHVPFKDLGQIPKYAGFVQSPQYAEWLDYLEAKKKAAAKDAPKKPAAGVAVKPGSP